MMFEWLLGNKKYIECQPYAQTDNSGIDFGYVL